METSFTVQIDIEGTVVRVSGDLDVMAAPRLREQFADLVRRGHYDVVVDLDEVSFLDSTGLAVLVNALKRVRAHDGWLRLVCTNERTIQIFRITGLTRTFGIYPTTAEALAAWDGREAPRGLWLAPPPGAVDADDSLTRRQAVTGNQG